jgi:hypothetical protein
MGGQRKDKEGKYRGIVHLSSAIFLLFSEEAHIHPFYIV